jgi:peptidyl-prolyl cis-trans isomerase SurA
VFGYPEQVEWSRGNKPTAQTPKALEKSKTSRYCGTDTLAEFGGAMLAEGTMKKLLWAIGLFMLSFALGTRSHAETVNRIVATVDDEPITLWDVKAFGKNPGQRGMFTPPEGMAGMSERDILEILIMNKLIGKEVETQGIKAKDSDIDSYIERIKTQGNLDDEQFAAALQSQGLTMENYRKQVAEEIERALLVNREIGSRVNVTPEDVERYYKEHAEDYSQPEQVRVRHIFLPLSPSAPAEEEKEAITQIEDIRKRALAGEDFAALADAHSRGPGAGQGGDLGYFKKGQMAKEIDEVAFSLKPGDISPPFRTAVGFHLIKVEEHMSAGQKTLDPEVTEEIKRKLYNDALRKRYERWFQEDLRFRHHIENFLTASTSRSSPVTTNATDTSSPGTESTPSESTEKQQETKSERGFFRRLLPF